MNNSPERIKERIDGYHALLADNQISAGDCSDEINNAIASVNDPAATDELFDYVFESAAKFGLND